MNLQDVAVEMMGRAVLVVWSGADLPSGPETRGPKHRIRILLKAESVMAYSQLARSILEGRSIPRAMA